MANISTYPIITPKAGDLLVGSETYDSQAANPTVGNPTRNFTVSSITSSQIPNYINGTINTIPIFTSANTLGDSIMFKRSDTNDLIVGNFPDGQYTTIGEGYVSVTGGIGCSNITAVNGGIVVFNGSVQIGNETTDVLTINSETSFTALPSFADDAAASSLAQGRLYQTDGTGAAPLNVAGIVMRKQ